MIMDIEQLRSFCLSLPAVTEDIKWGHDLVFSIGGKMFCVTSLEAPHSISFKVPDEDFEALSIQPHFSPAPYMARSKWVLHSDPAKLGKKVLEAHIRESYELVKAKLTKKMR